MYDDVVEPLIHDHTTDVLASDGRKWKRCACMIVSGMMWFVDNDREISNNT